MYYQHHDNYKLGYFDWINSQAIYIGHFRWINM